jgi:hypothetical protein
MVRNSDFAYAQARVQARHGARPGDATWRRLEAIADLTGFIYGLRETSLGTWIESITPSDDSHTIERLLRVRWSSYTGRIASWTPSAWQPAFSWLSILPVLPAMRYLQEGATPLRWFGDDHQLKHLGPAASEELTPARVAPTVRHQIALSPEQRHSLDAWASQWRRLWPGTSTAQDRALRQLQAAVNGHLQSMREAGVKQDGDKLRGELAAALTRLFRRHAQSPVAIFCHLGLTALDVERMRGGLTSRSLFPPGHGAH